MVDDTCPYDVVDYLRVINADTHYVKADLAPNGANNTYSGFVWVSQVDGEAAQIFVKIEGLEAGSGHAFHIHNDNDVESGCAGAGGHFNPLGLDTGYVGLLGGAVVYADDNGVA
jgi:Cu/Zn superoxide dismutase